MASVRRQDPRNVRDADEVQRRFRASLAPEILEAVRRQFAASDGVFNVLVPHGTGLLGVDARACSPLMRMSAYALHHLAKPASENGEARSDTNTRHVVPFSVIAAALAWCRIAAARVNFELVLMNRSPVSVYFDELP
jgi:hypothetical protein